MSLLARAGILKKPQSLSESVGYTMLSMVEVALFFGVLSVLYFVGISSLYVTVRNHQALKEGIEQAQKYSGPQEKYSGADVFEQEPRSAREMVAAAKKLLAAVPPAAPAPAEKAPATRATAAASEAVALSAQAEKIDSQARKIADLAAVMMRNIASNYNTAPVVSQEFRNATEQAAQEARQAQELALRIHTLVAPGSPYVVKIQALELQKDDVPRKQLANFFSSKNAPRFFEWSLFTEVPVWLWFVQGGVYLLLVTIYWAPVGEGVNEIELRALVLTMLAALIAAAAANFALVSGLAETFWNIITG
ncbi:MAG: hypothetical protein LLG01_01865 [Planctomycetaceae bacterium]|nr:hypothetical protein [Planctomycetaceae bacterium]